MSTSPHPPATSAVPAAAPSASLDDAWERDSAGPGEGLAAAEHAHAHAGDGDGEDPAERARRDRRLRLMQRIEAQPDFASMKESMLRMQKVTRSDRAHVRALSGLIDDDPAMTGKLLRLINAAYYKSVGGGQITSIPRAISLMGFRSIGLLASSLLMFERLPKGADGEKLRQEFARAQLAALLAHDLCRSRQHIEHIYIAGLFQRLGDMLAGMHFAEAAQVFDDLLDERELARGTVARHEAREALAREQWGMSIEEIGLEMAGQWGWPPPLLLGMRRLHHDDPERVLEGDEYVRVLCTAANGLAEALMRLPAVGTPDERAEARAAVVRRFAAEQAVPLGLDPEQLPELVEATKTVWDDLLAGLGITLADAEAVASAKAQARSKKAAPGSLQYRQALAQDLADAVETLGRMNRRGEPAEQVMNASLKLVMQALDLQRAMLCLRDPDSGHLKGRLGVGDRAVVLTPHFDIPLAPPACLFGLLCVKNADTHISDTADPIIAQRLPAWFTQKVKAGGFIVLPMVAGNQVLGMVYGDQAAAKGMHLNDRALVLLKSLRQQLMQALAASKT